jgi:multiple sugar transport system permease protein
MTELAVPRTARPTTPPASPLVRQAEARRRGQRAGWSQRRDRRGIWFVLPFITAFLLFMVVPLLYAIYESLYTTQLIGGTHFSGFANYSATFSSSAFWSSVAHVVVFGAVQIPIMLVVAFFFAAIFDLGVVKLPGLWRTIMFVPFAVPAVVAAVMWQFLLEPTFGPFVHAANALGFSSTNFFSPNLIWPTIFVIVIWEWTGYTMIIFYTALKAVPRDVVEAAVIDGATLRKIVTRVKLPMVRPAIIMLVFLNTIGALQMFVEPQILSEFQPQAINDHFTPTIYIYNTGVAGQQYNLAAAAAVVLALVIVAISMSLMLLRVRRGGLL